MTDCRPRAVLSDPQLDRLPPELQADLERYVNQGGLLGAVTYALVYLDSGDETAAARAASIPTNLFVASCLHDDAIDLADEREADCKPVLNWRVTVGDVVYTRILDAVDGLGESFETATVTEQFRQIAYGQLREETTPGGDPSMAEAIVRVEERGSVWGELAVSPAVAGGYGGTELDHVSTVVEDVLFVLTLVDDVEDVPEDVENGVANLPVLLADGDPADYDSTAAFVDALVASDLPERLDAVVAEHEDEMSARARKFVDASEYTSLELVEALTRALVWYREAACTVPLDETVPPDRRATVRERLADERDRDAVLTELVAEFPLSVRTPRRLVETATTLPPGKLAPVVISLFHVSTLVDGVMTTDLDAALEGLRERDATAD
jgi:geranylgeranyl pyrophosphate synthase